MFSAAACFGGSWYVITRLMREFKKIESRDPSPWVEKLKLSVRRKNGVQVMMEPA
jgi:hypothetical protein